MTLLHDDARHHTENVTTPNLIEIGLEVLNNSLCSSASSPCDFHLFGRLKLFLGGIIYRLIRCLRQSTCADMEVSTQSFVSADVCRRLIRSYRVLLPPCSSIGTFFSSATPQAWLHPALFLLGFLNPSRAPLLGLPLSTFETYTSSYATPFPFQVPPPLFLSS